jgi:hypothetical protein
MTVPYDLAALDTIRSMSAKPIPNRRELMWLACGKKCHWCGCDTVLTPEQRADQATIDHVIPEGKGGTNDESNVVSACFACNQRRNHEVMHNLPDGHLLGKRWSNNVLHTPLAIRHLKGLPGAPPAPKAPKIGEAELVRGQRDAALKELRTLREANAAMEARLGQEEQRRERAEQRLRYLTLRQFLLVKVKYMLEAYGPGQD